MQGRARHRTQLPVGQVGIGGILKYRADIDGLRAVAIVPVVLFHANVAGFTGGFVGVDVFFVISGFLITSIIAEEIRQGQFSVLGFYERRIRRIFPALFAVLFVTAILAAWLLLPKQFDAFARSIFSMALLASNILFWREDGYFATSATEKPLLHTWSLSVEEQFYVVFPILLLLLHRWMKGRWIFWLAPIAILSFAISMWGTDRMPSATFYLAPMRAWELLIGSFLALGAFPILRNRPALEILSAAGMASILWSVFTFTEDTPFPGVNALYPCIGTALIIYTGQSNTTLVSRFLSLKPLVLIGLISFSLYLWHWPLLVFARIWNVYELTGVQIAIVIGLSFLASALSWKFIEGPFRRRNAVFMRRGLFSAAITATIAFLAFGTYGFLSKGWPERVPPLAMEIAAYADSQNPRRLECRSFAGNPVEKPCVFGASVTPSYMIWGDSHADSVIDALGKIAGAHNQSIMLLASVGCPPLTDVKVQRSHCREHIARVMKILEQAEHIKTVVLMARYAVHVEGRTRDLGPAERASASVFVPNENGLVPSQQERREQISRAFKSTVSALTTLGKHVVLVYPIPEIGYNVPQTVARLVIRGDAPTSFTLPADRYKSRQESIFRMLDDLGQDPRIRRVYPHKKLCDETQCIVYADGKPLYRDDDHLSRPGADYIAPLFTPIFENTDPTTAGATR